MTQPHWDLLLTDARLATLRPGPGDYGIVEDAALAIRDGRIDWLGPAAELPPKTAAVTEPQNGRWLTPGLIDCHTHLVFAGDRSGEFEQRLSGTSYEAIAAAGGGIMSTVRETRAATPIELVRQSAPRLATLVAEGVTTVEIKSGYGLDADAERRMLEAARAVAAQAGVSVSRTFLGAHTVPADWTGSTDDYLALVRDEMLPSIHADGLADSVDAYCESIAFSASQVATLFRRADELGLPVRLHADQLSDGGGAALAARFRALSADHLEYASAPGIDAMAESGTVAVLLPGAFLTLRETRCPPVDRLRASGVPIAIATDCNPGTSPLCSIRAAMHLAASAFRLTPAECLAGVTREAARALGLLDDRGTLEPGKRADLLAWDIEHPAELSYWLGVHRPRSRWIEGVRQD